MSMTKKDYELVASTIRSEYEAWKANAGPVYGQEALGQTKHLAERLANRFELSNPKFDRKKFLTSCGVSLEHENNPNLSPRKET